MFSSFGDIMLWDMNQLYTNPVYPEYLKSVVSDLVSSGLSILPMTTMTVIMLFTVTMTSNSTVTTVPGIGPVVQ